MVVLTIVAVVCIGLPVIAWLVYPAAMWLAARIIGNPAQAASESRGGSRAESVAVVIATRDDPAVVVARVEDILATRYPHEQLRVVVAVDVTATHALSDYQRALASRATVVPGDSPGGKASTLNAGVRAARDADVIVFADAGQTFDENAIPKLVEFLANRRFGAVTGRYTLSANDDTIMSAYANFEALVRAGQSSLHSVVSTSGSIYAVRPGVWRPLPAGLICDDLFTTVSIVRQGYRVGFCSDAVACDPRVFSRDQQLARRIRTLTGLVQFCMMTPSVLVPWRNPIWLHLMLHKILRILTPALFAVGFVALLLRATASTPGLFVATLIGIVLMTLAARFAAERFAKLDVVGFALRLQLVPFIALSNGMRRRWTVWTIPDGQPNPPGTGGGAP